MNYYQYFHSKELLFVDRRCCLVTHFLVEGEPLPQSILHTIHFGISLAYCIVKIIKIWISVTYYYSEPIQFPCTHVNICRVVALSGLGPGDWRHFVLSPLPVWSYYNADAMNYFFHTPTHAKTKFNHQEWLRWFVNCKKHVYNLSIKMSLCSALSRSI